MSHVSTSNDIRRELVTLLPRLRRFALTLTDTSPEADELVRNAALHAIQKSHHWRGEGRIELWLFSLMRSLWSEEARRRLRAGNAGDSSACSSRCGAAADFALSLPEGISAAFLLTEVENFSCKEAAGILGLDHDLLLERLCMARLAFASADKASRERRA